MSTRINRNGPAIQNTEHLPVHNLGRHAFQSVPVGTPEKANRTRHGARGAQVRFEMQSCRGEVVVESAPIIALHRARGLAADLTAARGSVRGV